MVRAGHYEGPIKKVLSGLCMVEKAGRIPTIVQASEWQMVKAMEKLQVRRIGVQVRWAPSSIFGEMVTKRAMQSWAKAMAVLACTNLLRVSEAITMQRKGHGVLEFFGVKNRVGWHVQPVGPWAGRWLEFLRWGRQKHTGRTEHSGNLEACERWTNNSRSWWHRHHGQNCDGTTYEDLWQPSYGPAGAEGARWTWQGVGKPLRLHCTMPAWGIP